MVVVEQSVVYLVDQAYRLIAVAYGVHTWQKNWSQTNTNFTQTTVKNATSTQMLIKYNKLKYN